MSNDWVRLWHDMPTDPKWRVIARKSGQPLAAVISMFTMLMVEASKAAPRGSIAAWRNEDAAAALDIDEEEAAAIFEAMRGRVHDGEHLTGWEKRQPKREDDTAAQRKREQRERDKAERHATSHNVTPDKETEAETDERCSDANASGAEAPPVDPKKALYDAGKKLLIAEGMSKSAAGAFITKLCAEHGGPAVQEALAVAVAEGRNDAKAYIIGCLKRAEADKPTEAETALVDWIGARQPRMRAGDCLEWARRVLKPVAGLPDAAIEKGIRYAIADAPTFDNQMPALVAEKVREQARYLDKPPPIPRAAPAPKPADDAVTPEQMAALRKTLATTAEKMRPAA